jgi:hypothetical protein
VIHAFALEPQLVATWGRREAFRFFHEKFGLGTPRVFLELQSINKWMKEVRSEANALGLSELDMSRIEELHRLFREHKHRRADAVYDGLRPWLENAEAEYARRSFAAILATQNPRNHDAVLTDEQLGPGTARWTQSGGDFPARTADGIRLALAPMINNCKQLHLVDPHFGPENRRHREVIVALMQDIESSGRALEVVRIHCSAKSKLDVFETEAKNMATRLPAGLSIEFVRWQQRDGGDRLHNRYVLTDVGGVSLGIGLDAGKEGETDDISLLTREQYLKRWAQYVDDDGSFECADRPKAILGTRSASTGTKRR